MWQSSFTDVDTFWDSLEIDSTLLYFVLVKSPQKCIGLFRGCCSQCWLRTSLYTLGEIFLSSWYTTNVSIDLSQCWLSLVITISDKISSNIDSINSYGSFYPRATLFFFTIRIPTDSLGKWNTKDKKADLVDILHKSGQREQKKELSGSRGCWYI